MSNKIDAGGNIRRQNHQDAWLGYYCKVNSFEAYGGAEGTSLVLDITLLEPVPKVTSLELTIYSQRPATKSEKDWNCIHATSQTVVSSQLLDIGLALRRPDGWVDIATWWHPSAVTALLSILLSGRQLYVNFSARKFYRNRAQVGAISWYTEGTWRRDVVGEDSELY